MFSATNVVRNNDKSKYLFSNDSAKNIKIFSVDNSSSSHTDNSKNDLFVLGEELTYDINGSFGTPEKEFSINFSK